MCEKFLRNIAEAHCGHNTIPTEGVLSWFLQVQHSADVFLFELSVEVEVLDESLGGPLHGEYVVSDPIRMQSLNGVGLHFVGQVVLLVAGVPPAKLTEEDGFFVEFVDLEPQ